AKQWSDNARVEVEVQGKAREVARKYDRPRRRRILREATKKFEIAAHTNEVTSSLFAAMQALFGSATGMIACKNKPGSSPPKNELIDAWGDVITEAPELEAGRGHVGTCIDT